MVFQNTRLEVNALRSIVAVAAMVTMLPPVHAAKAHPLEVKLNLRSSSPPAGTVTILNTGTSELRIWRTGNSWGDMTMLFELKIGRKITKIIPKVKNYSVNAPFKISLSAGQDYKIEFNIGDGEWTPDLWRGRALPKTGELTAVYYIPRSQESDQYSVWTGIVRSAPVNLKLP